MKNKKFCTATIIVLSLLFASCRKDIPVPNKDAELIFGTWTWVYSSGGESGNTITPKTQGYTETIEFKKNGLCKIYKDGKQESKQKFRLTEGNTIYNQTNGNLIEYKKMGIHRKNSNIESYIFYGNDTLVIRDEWYDGFGHVYVREK